MKHYKKRTIALCLASLITVVGAFGAENYNNSLMGIRINKGSDGFVSLTAYTKQAMQKPTQLIRLDNNTYAFVLPETDSQTSDVPDVRNYRDIESIEILTLPYTTESAGSTKIVIKTLGTPVVKAEAALYIEEKPNINKKRVVEEEEEEEETPKSYQKQAYSNDDNSVQKEKESSNVSATTIPDNIKKEDYTVPDYYGADQSTDSNFHRALALMCVLVLVVIFAIIFVISKNKMSSVVGENADFDLDEEAKFKEKEKDKALRRSHRKIADKINRVKMKETSSVNIVTGAVTEHK